MSEISKSEAISRRSALSLFGKVAAFATAASTTALTVSDAEAQTLGMERRQDRREGRHERRDDRRTGRHERRDERRTGATTTTGTGTGTTTGSGAGPKQ
jgi:Ni/Co efflux regulator RcnB